MSDGWICLHRKILDHWLWSNDPLTESEAWIYILLNVNHKEKKMRIGGRLMTCGKGESLKSLNTWAKEFRWHKSKVRRFFNLLKSDSIIDIANEGKTTRLTVCKWESYQQTRNGVETELKRKRNGVETELTPNNNVNKENNVNKGNKIAFEIFWNEYDKKVNPGKCEKKWNGLSLNIQKEILEYIPKYKESQPEKQYRKNPLTFLNNKTWKDELISKEPNQSENKEPRRLDLSSF